MARIIQSDGKEYVVAHAAYLESALNDLDSVVLYAKEGLARFDGCDTIVGRGLSGALIVPVIARALGLHWCIVRKPNDGTHSHERVEGTIGKRWVFVDDLICSGETLTRTVERINETCEQLGFTTELLGAYTYAPARVWVMDLLPLPEGYMPNFTRPCDTQDENGNPVYAPLSKAAMEFFTNPDVMGFLDTANKLPTMEEVYEELKGKYYTQKPKAPKPVRRGGKARRQLDQLKEMQAAQQAAANLKMDTIAQQMINALQEKMR